MNHGIRNSFLYASSHIISYSRCENGSEKRLSGTGFWIENINHELCLVTNRHIIEHSDISSRLCDYFDVYIWLTINGNTEEKPVGPYLFRISNYTPKFPKNPLDDVVCIKQPFTVTPFPPCAPTQFRLNYFYPYSLLATQSDFNNRISVCDMLAFIGYPEPFYDTERQAPILRSGIIASDPRYNYMGKQFGNCLAYEAFSLGGSSGSPVLAIQKGFQVGGGLQAPTDFYRELKLIGINWGYRSIVCELSTKQIPSLTVQETQHSGISLLYKSTSIMEAINS